MCGIYGVFHFDAASPVPAGRAQAVDILAHRGPDARGCWRDGPVLLAMRRLSIIDLAGGHQPIWNEEGTHCIVYNGEIYNFADLRGELERRGHRFVTDTDTEVVLHGYEEWGPDCLRRLNGMFALAIWDGPRRLLMLARDRLGEKPLYYYRDSRRLVFASEVKAILSDPTIPRSMAPEGLANYLAFGHAVGPQTIFADVLKLQPGHYLLTNESGCQLVQYWDVGEERHDAASIRSGGPAVEEAIRWLLDDAVRRRMVADVPVGAFLSGGVDSSTIVGLMQRHASGPVKTFALGFTAGKAFNELDDARRVAEYFGTDHYELEVDHRELAPVWEKLVYHYDEPFADAAGLPLYLLSRFARQQVKVVLAGDGGDELFGGYRRYAADQFGGMFRRLPAWAQTEARTRVARLPRLRRAKRTLEAWSISDPVRRYAAWLWLFTPELQEEVLAPNLAGSAAAYDPARVYALHASHWRRLCAEDSVNRLLYLDLKTWLVDTYLEKTDKATMACGLEARLPLLDHRLVELAFCIPGHAKVRGLATKRIFKRAVSELVPSFVLRKPKHGFAVPTDPWLRGSLREYAAAVLFDGRMAARGYWKMSSVDRLWQEHQSGRHVWSEHLWVLLNLEMWQRCYLDSQDGFAVARKLAEEV
jgi:asparagine synthase (glutamine-hydrolysing)